MAHILQRPRAQEDILEIWSYIADDSEAHADTLIDKFDTKFRLLARSPELGRPRDELAHGIRSFPVGRYVIFYELIPNGIAVIRVLHSARDIDAQFEHDTGMDES